MQWMKIAHSFLRSVSDPLYHFKLAYEMSKNFFEPTSKNGEIGRFNWYLLMESF